jgi:hypothetical protein
VEIPTFDILSSFPVIVDGELDTRLLTMQSDWKIAVLLFERSRGGLKREWKSELFEAPSKGRLARQLPAEQ